MSILTWLAGPYIDITPDPDTMAMLDEAAACDKHRLLLDDAAIEAYQARIVERGGTVHVDDITPILPPVATYPVKVRILTPAQHAARLKGRKAQ